MEDYYKVRFEYYEKRKSLQLEKLKETIIKDVSKYTFIKAVIDEEVNLKNKSYEQIEKQLLKIKNIVKINDSFDYLLNMSFASITKEHYLKLKEQLSQMKVKLNELKSIKAQDLWQSDLNKVSKYL